MGRRGFISHQSASVGINFANAPAHAASLNKRPETKLKNDERFVLQTRFTCMIPRGRLPSSVCLSLVVSTAAQQDWPSTRFNFSPSKYKHSRERRQGRTLQQLRPCATSGTNQTKENVSSENWSLRTFFVVRMILYYIYTCFSFLSIFVLCFLVLSFLFLTFFSSFRFSG